MKRLLVGHLGETITPTAGDGRFSRRWSSTVSDQEFIASITDLDERRRTLLGLVESDEGRWPSPQQA